MTRASLGMREEFHSARRKLLALREKILRQLTQEEIQRMKERDKPVTLPPVPIGSIRVNIWATEVYPVMYAEEWGEDNDPRHQFWADLPSELWEEYEAAFGALATAQGKIARWLDDTLPIDDPRFENSSMDRWIEESVDLG